MKLFKIIFFILFFCLIATAVFSQENNEDLPLSNLKNKPQNISSKAQPQQTIKKSNRYPVTIEYEGQDSLGIRLVLEMKEYMATSKIFRLSSSDEKKIKIYIKTKEEFPSRPGLGSVYCIVWTFSAGKDVLSSYLDGEVGSISYNQVKSIVEVLLSKTDEVISQYSYLFER